MLEKTNVVSYSQAGKKSFIKKTYQSTSNLYQNKVESSSCTRISHKS